MAREPMSERIAKLARRGVGIGAARVLAMSLIAVLRGFRARLYPSVCEAGPLIVSGLSRHPRLQLVQQLA